MTFSSKKRNAGKEYFADKPVWEAFVVNLMMRFVSIKQMKVPGEASSYISVKIKRILIRDYIDIDVVNHLSWQIITDDTSK